MIRPREVLLNAAMEDARPHVTALRERGWPAELVAVSGPIFFGLRIEIPLDAIPVPIETGEDVPA